MMLWDIIRDFFVQYVFGGYTHDHQAFGGNLGFVWSWDSEDLTILDTYSATDNFGLPMTGFVSSDDNLIQYMTMGDWLSTTATIIVLVLLCVCAGMFVRWMFKWIGGCLSRLGR